MHSSSSVPATPPLAKLNTWRSQTDISSTPSTGILGEPHTTVHRWLSYLLADSILGRASHGTAHVPLSGRYCLTAKGIRQTGDIDQIGRSRRQEGTYAGRSYRPDE